MLKTAMNVLRRFRQEDDAVVAIQVVIFSVMLLTSTGLVIDFGRAYSAHSQMQSFVDKAALAAANELDGEQGALTRATNAALAVSQSSSFTEGEAEFRVQEPLTFLSANPVDGNGAFSEAALTTFATELDDEATHVFVQADARTIKLAFLSIGLDGVTETGGVTDRTRAQLINEGTQFFDENGNPINQIDDELRQRLSDATDGTGELNMPTEMQLSAFAVARMQVSYCGDISTMVMCNPFENERQSFAEIMDDQEGAIFRLTSDRDNANNPMPLSTNDNLIRVGLLKNPLDEIGGDPDGICSDANLERVFSLNPPNTDNGGTGTIASTWQYSTSDDELEQLRDMCLLATIEPQLQCIGGDVIVKAAEPETITTSLNTLFDIWDAPMDRVLSLPVTSDRDFAPDYVAPHGMLTRAEYDVHFVQEQAGDAQADVADAEQNIVTLTDTIAALEAKEEAEGLSSRETRTLGNARDELYAEGNYAAGGRFEGRDAYSRLDTAQRDLTALLLETGVYPDEVANSASRRNYLEVDGATHDSWGPMLSPTCLKATSGANCPIYNGNIAMPEVLTTYGESSTNRTAIGPNEPINDYYPPAMVPVEGSTTGEVEEIPAAEYFSDGVTADSRGVVPSTGDTIWVMVNNTDQYQDAVVKQAETGLDFDIRIDPRSVREIQFQAVPYEVGDPEPSQNIFITWRNGTLTPAYPNTDLSHADLDPAEVVSLTYVASFLEYVAGYYGNLYDAGVDFSNPTTTEEWDIALAQTMYEGYSLVERQYDKFLDANLSAGPGSDRSVINTEPTHYQFASSNVRAEQPEERRRQRIAVINCSVMDTVPTDGLSDVNAYSGAYISELEAVIDVFYTRPVHVTECDLGSTTDQVALARDLAKSAARDAWEASGQIWDSAKEQEWLDTVWQPALDSVDVTPGQNAISDCWNEDIDVANVYAEFIGIADPADENSEDFRSYAVLVH